MRERSRGAVYVKALRPLLRRTLSGLDTDCDPGFLSPTIREWRHEMKASSAPRAVVYFSALYRNASPVGHHALAYGLQPSRGQQLHRAVSSQLRRRGGVAQRVPQLRAGRAEHRSLATNTTVRIADSGAEPRTNPVPSSLPKPLLQTRPYVSSLKGCTTPTKPPNLSFPAIRQFQPVVLMTLAPHHPFRKNRKSRIPPKSPCMSRNKCRRPTLNRPMRPKVAPRLASVTMITI